MLMMRIVKLRFFKANILRIKKKVGRFLTYFL